MKKPYCRPLIVSEQSFDTSALSCGKTPVPPAGSHHWNSAYDTFTGHFGPGFGTGESSSGAPGVGFGPGGTSLFYNYSGLCLTWITYVS
jgi:hypothetical protein